MRVDDPTGGRIERGEGANVDAAVRANGRFLVEVLSLDAPTFALWVPGYQPVTVRPSGPNDAGVCEAGTVRLTPGIVVSGQCVLPDGPWPRETELVLKLDGWGLETSVPTESDGRFVSTVGFPEGRATAHHPSPGSPGQPIEVWAGMGPITVLVGGR